MNTKTITAQKIPNFISESTDLSVDWTKPSHSLSLGAGVQSSSKLFQDPDRYRNGFILFADPGDEKPETYWYIEKYLKPFCRENNLRWITVAHLHKKTLMNLCLERNTLPIKSKRWCTRDMKIMPIRRFLRFVGAKKKHPAIIDIGISTDEAWRAKLSNYEVLFVKKEFPLIDDGISRNDCVEQIKKHGYPVPVKSGCDFCPFQSKKDIIKLKANRPARFLQIMKMEKNDRLYPAHPLIGKQPLENLLLNQSLDQFSGLKKIEEPEPENQSCLSGYCGN